MVVQETVHYKSKYSTRKKVTKLGLIKSVALYHNVFENTGINICV